MGTPIAIEKYFKVYNDKSDMGEIEWRRYFEKYIIRDLLGYPKGNIRFEKDRTDLRILDDYGRSHIVIETKIIDGHLELESTKEQAFGYVNGGEVFVITASPKRIFIYDVVGNIKKRIYIESIQEPLSESAAVWELSYENMVAESYLDEFRSGLSEFCYIDTQKDLIKLIDNLHICNALLNDYANWAWTEFERQYKNEYLPGLEKYKEDILTIETTVKDITIANEKVRFIKAAIREHERRYVVPIEIFNSSYPEFKEVQPYSSGRTESDYIEIYLNDVVYAALNRILFIRIAEDKEFVSRKISNGGIGVWRQFVKVMEEKYPELLRVAYKDAAGIYSWFFEPGVFDWYIKDGIKLNRVLEKVFFILNAFDFSKLNQNTLAELYQEYLPPEKRKKLGEFYTPEKVVEYILDATGYHGPGKVLDFACGSGGFLIPAARRKLEEAKEREVSASVRLNLLSDVVGFDINPFATHIATMNQLFLALDTYEEGLQREDDVKFPMFNIFNIDSLIGVMSEGDDPIFKDIIEKRSLSDVVYYREMRNYDYVVGNPPYVRNERLSKGAHLAYSDFFGDYKKGNTDIFNYFLIKSFDWLKDGGRFGVIVSFGLADSDASLPTRKFLNGWQIDEIVPLEWCKVFGASVNPMIIIMTKKRPDDNHKIKIRQGVQSLDGFYTNNVTVSEIPQEEWTEIAPDGSWRLEVKPGDLPIIEKLEKMPTPMKATYGLELRTKAKGRVLISRDVSELENPIPLIDGRNLKTWSLVWDSMYIDYMPDLISKPLSKSFFSEKKILIPRISKTIQASVNENNELYVGRNTIMYCDVEKQIDKENDIYYSVGLSNSLISRYYSFLFLRGGVIQEGYSTMYVGVIDNIPFPETVDEYAYNMIVDYTKSAHDVASTMVNSGKRVLDNIDKAVSGFIPFAKHASADFRAYTHALDVRTTEVYNEGILLDSTNEIENMFGVKGDLNILKYILYRATLEGEDKLSKSKLEKFLIPVDDGSLDLAISKLEDWSEEKPNLGNELRGIENEINELAFDLYGFSKKETDYIKRRCSEFPMSEVLKTELPGSSMRQISTKIYEPGKRYS